MTKNASKLDSKKQLQLQLPDFGWLTYSKEKTAPLQISTSSELQGWAQLRAAALCCTGSGETRKWNVNGSVLAKNMFTANSSNMILYTVCNCIVCLLYIIENIWDLSKRSKRSDWECLKCSVKPDFHKQWISDVFAGFRRQRPKSSCRVEVAKFRKPLDLRHFAILPSWTSKKTPGDKNPA